MMPKHLSQPAIRFLPIDPVLGDAVLDSLRAAGLPTHEPDDDAVAIVCLSLRDPMHLDALAAYRRSSRGHRLIAVFPVGEVSDAWKAFARGATHVVPWTGTRIGWQDVLDENHLVRPSERECRLCVDHLPTGVFAITDGTLDHTNPVFRRLVGWNGTPSNPARLSDFAVSDDREPLEAFLREPQATGPERTHICRFLRNGDASWIGEIRVHRPADASQDTIGTLRDVTDEQRLSRLHRRVLKLGRTLLLESDFDRILQLVLDTITELGGFRRAVLSLYDLSVPSPLDGRIVKILASGLADEEIDALWDVAMSPADRRTAFSETYRMGDSYYIPSGNSPWGDNVGLGGTVSMDGWDKDDFLFIPLRAQAGIIGSISVDDPLDPSAPTPASIAPVESLATFAALAVERAFKLRQNERQKARLHGLSVLGTRMSRVREIRDICQLAAQQALENLEHEFCAIWLIDRQDLVLGGIAHVGGFRGKGNPSVGKRLPLEGNGICREALRRNEIIVVPDVEENPHYRPSRDTIRSMVAVPVPGSKGSLAVIDVESTEVDAIREDDTELLTTLAGQLSIAIAGLRRREASARIHSFGQRLATVTDVDSLVSSTMDFLGVQMGFAEARVYLTTDDDDPQLASPRESSANDRNDVGHPDAVPPHVEQVIQTRTCVFIHRTSEDSTVPSALAVPILFTDRLLGVLSVRDERAEVFDDEDRQALEVTANHLAIALSNLFSQQSLREQAIRDSLTGLYNRHYFNEIIDAELARSDRYRRPITLMMIDIDGFRAVNNHLGHLRGDEVLRDVATLLRNSVRTSDRVIRYGGDEFLVFMPETDSDVSGITDRLRIGMRQLARDLESHGIPIALSIGTYTRQPDDVSTLETILEEVDRRMYVDKRTAHKADRDDAHP